LEEKEIIDRGWRRREGHMLLLTINSSFILFGNSRVFIMEG